MGWLMFWGLTLVTIIGSSTGAVLSFSKITELHAQILARDAIITSTTTELHAQILARDALSVTVADQKLKVALLQDELNPLADIVVIRDRSGTRCIPFNTELAEANSDFPMTNGRCHLRDWRLEPWKK